MKENRPNRQSNTQAKATRGTRKEQPSARLVVAYALLQMMRQSAYSNLVAESRFDALESPRDRAFASTLFYGVLERQITLRRIVAAYCRKPVRKLDPEVLCILEMGLYQLLFLDSVPERAAVNESVLLTRKLASRVPAALSTAYCAPLSGMENPSVPARRSSRRWSAFRRRLQPRRSCASC